MHLHLVTAPAAEPVALATVKVFLRVDGTDEDSLITSLAKAAREEGEKLSRRAFITQTWEMIIECWPHDWRLRVYRPPLQSITSVKYFDSDNAEHTFTDYVVDTRSEPGVIIFNSLPSATLQKSGAIVVRFVAGYGAAGSNVPERINNLILALTAYWYENRETHEVPAEIKKAFIAERAVWF
jgi:uncharacterized phiE125 gp8 family phage protein